MSTVLCLVGMAAAVSAAVSAAGVVMHSWPMVGLGLGPVVGAVVWTALALVLVLEEVMVTSLTLAMVILVVMGWFWTAVE